MTIIQNLPAGKDLNLQAAVEILDIHYKLQRRTFDLLFPLN
jgi:hypothetical protein